MYGALDVRLFPNKRLNVDLKNIEVWVSHGLNHKRSRNRYKQILNETNAILQVFSTQITTTNTATPRDENISRFLCYVYAIIYKKKACCYMLL